MRENLDVFDFTHRRREDRIAAMDTGTSLFFDHRDPAIVAQFSNATSTSDRPEGPITKTQRSGHGRPQIPDESRRLAATPSSPASCRLHH